MTKPLSQMTVHEKNIAVAELVLPCDWIDNQGNQSVDLVGTVTYLGAYGQPDERQEKYGEVNYCTPSAESQALQFDNRINMDFRNDDNGIATTYSFKSVDDDFMEFFTAENDNPCIAIVDCFLLVNGWVL